MRLLKDPDLFLATVTNSLQITLPMAIARKLGLQPGHKVIVSTRNGRIIVTPAKKLVQELAGAAK